MLKKLTQQSIKVTCLSISLMSGAWAASDDDDDTDYLPYNTKNAQEWSLVKSDERHQIKTYSKQEDNHRYRSFKAVAVFDASLETVARCQFDIENMTSWYMNAVESKMLKRVSDTEYYYYFRLKAPFGVPQRDVAVKATITPYSEKTGTLSISYTAVPDFVPTKVGVVRMPAYEMVLRFKPIGTTQVEEVMEGYVDPDGAGTMPKWMINYVQRRMPYVNMLGKHRTLEKCARSDSPILFKYKE